MTASQGGNRIYVVNPDGTENFQLGGSSSVEATPVVRLDAVGGDVVLFVSGGDLFAKKLDDSLVFRYTSGTITIAGSAVVPDGSGYYLAGTRVVKSGLDGSEVWTASVGGCGADQLPAVDRDGYVYVGMSTGQFRCIAPDGTLAWEYDTGTDLRYSSAAIGPDSRVYICGSNGTLYAFGPGA